ncbi:MAG: hypothetical protein AAB932_01745 [Patescibacteria group bacterium]
MDITQAKKIMGKHFIGPVELGAISAKLDIVGVPTTRIAKIPFTEQTLKKYRKNALLILGVQRFKNGKKMTLNNLRARFGANSQKEPCFYNQDWYLKEDFAARKTLKPEWYLVSTNVKSGTRGQNPERIKKSITRGYSFPSAVLAAFTFFAYYFHTGGKMLWKQDFIWCEDTDNAGDQIYVGRYPFNVHRHLRIRNNYGLAPIIN